jgi:hypothetical protein
MIAKTMLGLLLAGVTPLCAQVTATLNRLPNESSEIRLRNDSNVPLTTVAISVDFVNRIFPTPNPLVVYVDPVLDQLLPTNSYIGPLVTMPLLPQQEVTLSPEVMVAVSTLSGRPSFRKLGIAGVFAGGTTFGDTSLLMRLAIRRSNLLAAVETTLDLFSGAGRHNVPRSLLIGQFRVVADSLSRWYLPSEQQVGLNLYQSVIQKLISLPEGEVGSAFPPDTFVAQETAMLLRQRAALCRPGLRLRTS